MAMPSSGCIALRSCITGCACSSISCAVAGIACSPASLSSLSVQAGKSAPHAMTEFYGYSPNILSVNPDAALYAWNESGSTYAVVVDVCIVPDTTFNVSWSSCSYFCVVPNQGANSMSIWACCKNISTGMYTDTLTVSASGYPTAYVNVCQEFCVPITTTPPP